MTMKACRRLAVLAALAGCLARPASAEIFVSTTTRAMILDLQQLAKAQADAGGMALLSRFFDTSRGSVWGDAVAVFAGPRKPAVSHVADPIVRPIVNKIESNYPYVPPQVVIPQDTYLTPGQLRGMQARGQLQTSDSRVTTTAQLYPQQRGALKYVEDHPVKVMPYYPPTPAGQITKRADGIIGGLTDFGRLIVDLIRPGSSLGQ